MARLVTTGNVVRAALSPSPAEPRRRTTTTANTAIGRAPTKLQLSLGGRIHSSRQCNGSERASVATHAAKRARRKGASQEGLPEHETSDLCPCGSGLSYEGCCEPYHYGDKIAETPETLMRSRYSAFAKRETNYINDTMHPSHPEIKGISKIKMIQDISSTAKGCSFHKLAVLGSKPGESDDEATVSFRLWFKFVQWKGRKAVQDKDWQTLTETSTFKREGGRWLYLSGVEDFTPMPYGDTSPLKKAPSAEGLAEKAKEMDEKAKEMFSINSVTEGMKSVFGSKAPKK